jgi:sugar-specific transcriptional regulator TrmB
MRRYEERSMDFSKLRTIGLTEGEIRVYEALIELGETSTGRLMKKADISSSKVYLILEKLMQKGLVSSIQIEGVQHYQSTNPKTILEFIDSRKEELEQTRTEMEKIIPMIQRLRKPTVEESAQIYKGFKGIKAAYMNILDELKKGEEYRIFAMSGTDIVDPRLQAFFKAFHRQRIERGIHLKILVNSASAAEYKKNNLPIGKYTLHQHPLTLPVSMAVGKHRITSMIFHPENIAHEIVSDAITQKYREFFEKEWNASTFCAKVK